LVIERWPVGPLGVTAEADAYQSGRARTEIRAGETAMLEVALAPITWGTLRVQVADAETGQPLPGARLAIAGTTHAADDQGQITLGSLAAGVHALRASHPAYQEHRLEVTLDRAQVLDQVIALTPVTTGTLTGWVVDAETGEPLADARVTVADEKARSDAGGAFRLDAVTAGVLEVRASAGGYRVAQRTVELA
jgi:hypothetical protein